MNVVAKADSLYGDSRRLKHPREIEYEIFSRVTRRLVEAIPASVRTGNAPVGATPSPSLRILPDFAAALHENSRLWTALAIDLSHPDNGLPVDLRARLLSLASFVFKETGRILSGDGGDPNALVDMNLAIMRGLRERGTTG